MTYDHLRFLGLGTILGLGACIAPKSDSLGDAGDSAADSSPGDDDGGDDGATSSDPTAGSATSAGDDGATSGATTGATSGDTGEPPPSCNAGEQYLEPAGCPDVGLQLPAADCYETCDGPGDACSVGTCVATEYNPCPCPDDAEGCCAACAGGIFVCLDVPTAGICSIVGIPYRSVEALECGLGPDGPVLCNWTLEFQENGQFLWMYSDVGEGGTFTCGGDVLTITSGPMVDFSFDEQTQVLTWDGVDYIPDAA